MSLTPADDSGNAENMDRFDELAGHLVCLVGASAPDRTRGQPPSLSFTR